MITYQLKRRQRDGGESPPAATTATHGLGDGSAAQAIRLAARRSGGGGTVVMRDESTVSVASGSAVAAKEDKEEEFAEKLRESLRGFEAYLGWAGTLQHSEDAMLPEVLGWGSQEALWAAVLWAAHTWVRWPCVADAVKHKHKSGMPGALGWNATPRLGIFAAPGGNSLAGEGSGKSYLAKNVLRLSCQGVLLDTPTAPSFYRHIGTLHHTVGIDEGKLFLNGGASHRDILSALNTGYTDESETGRVWGNENYSMSTFGPVAVAALASIEFQHSSDDMKALMSRFIRINIEQAPQGYRAPRIRPADKENMTAIGIYMGLLLRDIVPRAAAMECEMPGWMSPRTAEIWEPLYLLAGLAGGEWPGRVVRCAEWLAHGESERAPMIAAYQKAMADAEALRTAKSDA